MKFQKMMIIDILDEFVNCSFLLPIQDSKIKSIN